jgi:hypothetical protein
MAFSPVSYQAQVDTLGNPIEPTANTAIAVGASTTIVKGAPGRVCRFIITTAGSSSDNAIIYDNASAGSGTILGVIPGGTTLTGAQVNVGMTAVNGITVVNVSSGPAFTIAYS